MLLFLCLPFIDMKLIEPSAEIVYCPPYDSTTSIVEKAIRTCYKSTEAEHLVEREKLIRERIKEGHLSTLEHVSMTVRLITGRGTANELVRHRMASYSQESTRYCNYGRDRFSNEISVIRPFWLRRDKYEKYLQRGTVEEGCDKIFKWMESIQIAEARYLELTRIDGVPAQQARGILPLDLKTEIIMTANFREWRHVFELRVLGTTGSPHPDIRLLLEPLLADLQEHQPVFFQDLIIPRDGNLSPA